jgi:hypothetical protein
MNIRKIISAFAIILMGVGLAYADVDLPTKFTNQGGISNTRHNLTQRPTGSTMNASMMDPYRNDYGEVCVYCHTPHGANTTVTLPLWNRTMKATTYTTYNQLGTSSLTQAVAQPGVNSLACLSCHDGQTAIDSIINMPGSGRYQASQATTQDNAFLSTWPNPSGQNASSHRTLNANAGSTSCLACHSAASATGDQATDFSVFAIGTDLKNDHPVGVTYPATTSGTLTDFKTPLGKKGTTFFFDGDGDGHMGGAEVRLYDNGGAAKVECASCHDPHGVPTGGAGSSLKPTFLRVANTNSALCLTCHAK